MATLSQAVSGRLIATGLGVIGVGLAGILVVQYGATATLDLLWSGLLGVLYIAIPVVVLVVLLKGFFRFNAWRG